MDEGYENPNVTIIHYPNQSKDECAMNFESHGN
jgi:hypothetical protein